MTDLRTAAQQALEALKLSTPKPHPTDDDYAERGWKEHTAAITALKAALAEPMPDYERGFIDGMQEQMKRSVDKAVNRMAEPVQEPVQDHILTCICGAVWDIGANGSEELVHAPPQRLPLTNEAIMAMWPGPMLSLTALEFARAIERAHGIGGEK